MGKVSKKTREFEAESRREAYKFWLGFFEKLFLLLFATTVIPFFIEKTQVPLAFRLVWASICLGLFVGILIFAVKLFRLSLNAEGGES